ncbi:hypothetical protein EDD22DRAFT_843204 [Suillus occidentalis]|nr:hypothetical protein EDD22DRAFT_843204 [Suillus occidentalis]
MTSPSSLHLVALLIKKPRVPHLYGMLWFSVAYSFLSSCSPPFHNCCLMASRKRKTQSTNRGWGWMEFTEHPGYKSSDPASMVQQKAKNELVMNSRYNLDHGIMYETRTRLKEQCGLLANMIHNEFGIVHSCARADLAAHFNQVTQPMAAEHATLSIPQLYEDLPQITGPSSAAHSIYPLSSAPPALSLFIPSLSVPLLHANGSSDLLSLPSPLAFDSRAPSPAISDITLLSLPLKCQHLTNSGRLGNRISAGNYLFLKQKHHQQRFSQNVSCLEFSVVSKPLQKKNVMVQSELCNLHAICVHDASGDSCNAEELLKQIIESINQVKSEWGVIIIACTTDASGESHKARRLLCTKFLHLVVNARIFNLIVGDLFKAKDDYGQYGDLTQELITWLRSKTYVIALLCELQMSTMGKTLTIIHAVLTQWLSHYLAYR